MTINAINLSLKNALLKSNYFFLRRTFYKANKIYNLCSQKETMHIYNLQVLD